NINVIEQVFTHKSNVALQCVRLDGVVLVQVKRVNVLEGKAFLLVHPDKFGVYPRGRGPGCQAKHTWFVLFLSRADKRCDLARNKPRSLIRSPKNSDRNLFEGSKVLVH